MLHGRDDCKTALYQQQEHTQHQTQPGVQGKDKTFSSQHNQALAAAAATSGTVRLPLLIDTEAYVHIC